MPDQADRMIQKLRIPEDLVEEKAGRDHTGQNQSVHILFHIFSVILVGNDNDIHCHHKKTDLPEKRQKRSL